MRKAQRFRVRVDVFRWNVHEIAKASWATNATRAKVVQALQRVAEMPHLVAWTSGKTSRYACTFLKNPPTVIAESALKARCQLVMDPTPSLKLTEGNLASLLMSACCCRQRADSQGRVGRFGQYQIQRVETGCSSTIQPTLLRYFGPQCRACRRSRRTHRDCYPRHPCRDHVSRHLQELLEDQARESNRRCSNSARNTWSL